MKLLPLIFTFYFTNLVNAWDSEQLEVFDAVDEVKENFYTLLNITQDATDREIRQAFRALSLKLHPDKNLDVDTSEQFRNLVTVYDILRSATKRKYYNEVLVNGLPNWRSAVYYYRYVRKMGMTEVCIILFVIVTIGQYLVNWGAYLEKIYTIEQNKKRKRKDRGEVIIEIPKPSFRDTLPIQIPRFIWFTIISIPDTCRSIKTIIFQQLEEARKAKEVEEVVEVPKVKTVRKRNKGFVVPEGPNFQVSTSPESTSSNVRNNTSSPPVLSGGLWTDDDLVELIKLVKKYPGGTPKRWEVIAETLGRSVTEITFMANKMKENGYKMPSEHTEEPVYQAKVKQKTKKAELDAGMESQVTKWSQVQQKALEDALAKYPKGCTERWDRIADSVPNKTKEECILRFRYLAETLRKQKENVEHTVENSEAIDQEAS